MNLETVAKILSEKNAAGPDAYLWLHSSGDCILWASESESVDDDGSHAIGRWTLSAAEIAELEATGEVDDVA